MNDLNPPNQHGRWDSLILADDVEQPMHAVREIHVGCPWLSEHDGVPRGPPAVRVARPVPRPAVRFRLDDAPAASGASGPVDQHHPEEFARDNQRTPRVEIPREWGSSAQLRSRTHSRMIARASMTTTPHLGGEKPLRVLLLSGGTGSGHVIAARAAEHELSQSGFAVQHLDAYAFVSKLARWAYTQLHLGLLEFAPELYGPLYELGSQSRLLAGLQQRLALSSRVAFSAALADIRPHVIFTTHALGCALAAPLKSAWGFRLAVLTTDYRAHAFQVHQAVDCYCASHEWAAADLAAAGIPPDRIEVTGIPLRPQFDVLPSRESARSMLGFSGNQPVILVTRGGMAAGMETVDLLKALLRSAELRHCSILALLGSRSRAHRLVTNGIAPTPRLRTERFVENMEVYLAAADVVVGKAGGLSSTETFAAERPLVMYAPNEGIETANVARFVAAGAAVNAGRSSGLVVEAVRELLASPSKAEALVAQGRSLFRVGSRQAVRAALARLALGVPEPVRASGRSA